MKAKTGAGSIPRITGAGEPTTGLSSTRRRRHDSEQFTDDSAVKTTQSATKPSTRPCEGHWHDYRAPYAIAEEVPQSGGPPFPLFLSPRFLSSTQVLALGRDGRERISGWLERATMVAAITANDDHGRSLICAGGNGAA